MARSYGNQRIPNLDDILPKNINSVNCDMPAVGSLLNDLQSGLEWNICTTKTNEGGYCIKFNTTQDACENSGIVSGSKADDGMNCNKFLRIDINPVRPSTSQQRQDVCADMAPLCPEEEKSPAKLVPSKHVAAKPSASHNKVEPAKEASKAYFDELKEEPIETSPEVEGDAVMEALESQKDSGRPAMLVCVLLGPSLDLMHISNVVQEMAKERDVTVRMNAPMH